MQKPKPLANTCELEHRGCFFLVEHVVAHVALAWRGKKGEETERTHAHKQMASITTCEQSACARTPNWTKTDSRNPIMSIQYCGGHRSTACQAPRICMFDNTPEEEKTASRYIG